MTVTTIRAKSVIDECRLLATMTEDPGRTTRRFLTSPVAEVHAHLRARMEALGMTSTVDAAGNLRGLWSPDETHQMRLVIGSHIDTVVDAGAFDGMLGVVLGLELVQDAIAIHLPYAIEVIAFSEEEGVRFSVPFLGSRAVAGRFDPGLLNLTDGAGVTLRDAIYNFRLCPEDIDNAIISDDTFGFLEIHIEQGPLLDAENLQIAVVTEIVGQTRCEISFFGHANHAGTTPMRLRHDAMAAAAEWVMQVESAALETEGLVATVGKVDVQPNAANVIPGRVRVSLDIRHPEDSIRTSVTDELLKRAQTIASRRRVRCELTRLMEQVAVPMDEELTELLAESVAAAGFPARRMPSGAGHDAMVMATRVPSAMLFLRSPGGLSHHPDENVLEEDVAAALKVGSFFLERLRARAV